MGMIGNIASGALEGFVAGGTLGAAANKVSQSMYASGILPRSFSDARMMNGATSDAITSGLLGAVVGGVMGAMGNDRPVSSAIGSLLGSDTFGGSKGTMTDVLSALASHLRGSETR